MDGSHINFRRIMIFGSCGLAGAIVGGVIAKVLVSAFSGLPAWELPAVVIGALAACLAAVLALPALIWQRRMANGKVRVPR